MVKKKKRGGSKHGGEKKVNDENSIGKMQEEKTVLEDLDLKEEEKKEEVQEEEPKFSVEDLMLRVEEYLENFDHEMALMFCQKALDMEPNNLKVLESYGNVCAEIGDIENAKKHFKAAVEMQPDVGHVKYLYLGQISEGRDAIHFYETAISLMKKEIENQSNGGSEMQQTLTNADVANVYCSLSELYMTDCCMDENAEEQCEKYCKLAVETDEKSLDAAVAMCNLLLSQEKIELAKNAAEKSFDLWSTLTKVTTEEMIPETMPYEPRVTLIKLLIEVECYDKVSFIVDQLIEENEDDIRIWYYLGLAKSLIPDSENPRFYLEKAVELFEKLQYEDEDMLKHINELLEKCPPEDEMDVIDEEEDDDDEDEDDQDMDVE